MGTKLRASRRIVARVALLGAVVSLALFSYFDPRGLSKHRRLQSEIRRAEAENRDLRQENAHLRRAVRALSGDPAALERAAREELGYVKPGEIVFNFGEEGKP
jgi:cell division protein FtsB